MNPAQVIGDVFLLIATPAIVLFTIRYGVWSNWRETAPGRAVFWLSTALSALVVLVFWAAFDRLMGFNTNVVREWFRVASYGFVAFASWKLLVTLVSVQQEGRDRRKTTGLTGREEGSK